MKYQRIWIWAFPDNHINFESHVWRIVKRAADRAKCILKCFSSRDKLSLARAIIIFVRPRLEFSSVIWFPYVGLNEIRKIEAEHRTFTKSISNFRLYTYHERLSI